jgi:hypothetical protein
MLSAPPAKVTTATQDGRHHRRPRRVLSAAQTPQVEIESAVGGVQQVCEVGHHPGVNRPRQIIDVVARRLLRHPDLVSRRASVDEHAPVSTQLPGWPSRSPLPTVAKASGVASKGGIAAVKIGAGADQQPHHIGVTAKLPTVARSTGWRW